MLRLPFAATGEWLAMTTSWGNTPKPPTGSVLHLFRNRLLGHHRTIIVDISIQPTRRHEGTLMFEKTGPWCGRLPEQYDSSFRILRSETPPELGPDVLRGPAMEHCRDVRTRLKNPQKLAGNTAVKVRLVKTDHLDVA